MRQWNSPAFLRADVLNIWLSRIASGNLELLLRKENEEKSGQEFEKWLMTRDQSFRQKHLIPDNDSLLMFKNFPEFIEARETLIKKRLSRLLYSWEYFEEGVNNGQTGSKVN